MSADIRYNQWEDVLLKLSEQIKVIYKDKLKAVILYGSVARGTATEDSDFDILVLVDAPKEQLKLYEDSLCEVSTDFALEYFRVFSIIDVSYDEYNEWKDVQPFYKNVAEEGIMLYAA